MQKLVCALAGILGIALFAADPVVSNVTAKQRYPWNGLVDITCNVSGMDDTTKVQKFVVSAVMPDSDEVRKMTHYYVMRDGVKSTDYEVNFNGNFQLLWDAKADLGEVFYSNMIVRVTLRNGKVQLWEGGPYWATTNIGAEEPEDYGYYFWWGDTVGYKRENNSWVASDGSSLGFSFSYGNTPTCNKIVATLKNEGWITSDGALAPAHDVAHVHWGGDWRMPTFAEFSALNSNCDWTWTTQNGVNGYIVRGRGDYAVNSIFLPCAGYGNGTSLDYTGSNGYYWSSVPRSDSSYYAYGLYFTSGSHGTNGNYRYYGQSVRPVQGFTK